jgi:hypothetical protein
MKSGGKINIRPTIFWVIVSISITFVILFAETGVMDSGAGAYLSVKGKPSCGIDKTIRRFQSNAYYTGPLIDNHVHMPTPSKIVSSVGKKMGFNMPAVDKRLNADHLACLFESEGIKKAFGFYLVTRFAVNSGWQFAAQTEKRYPGIIVPFFMPAPNNFINIGATSTLSIIKANEPLFKGIGEIKGEFESQMDFENRDLARLYEFADLNRKIVMIHPRQDQENSIGRILAKYPNAKFLLHGGDADAWITDLMAVHKNVFYSLDAGLTSLYGWGGPKRIHREPTKPEFMSYMEENFDRLVSVGVSRWGQWLELYPERFLWGTDRWYDWHFDPDVGAILEEFGRTFIGRLSSVAGENFAYRNAERILSSF